MGSHLDTIAPIVGAVLGSILLPGVGTALGASIGTAGGAAIGGGLAGAGVNYSHTHNLGSSLLAGGENAVGSYVGSNLGGSYLAGGPGSIANLGTIGGTLDSAIGTGASSDIASALGSGVGNALGSSTGSAIGSYAGNTLASGFNPQAPASQRGLYEPTYSTPGGSTGMPTSLNSMASLTPQQQSSSLATQGAYGGGLGPQEQGYFKSLVNNEIVGGQGPNAVENSYLSKLGFGNEGSNYNLAKALSQWNPNA